MTALWFPLEGAVSRLVHLHTGETVEAGLLGNDSVLGLSIALGATHAFGVTTVQIGGSALCISAADFNEHIRGRDGVVLHALLRYANLYMDVLGQLTACHALHRIEQRLSRCILTLFDYSGEAPLRVTHDTLADFLGVHRPSVTYALQALGAAGAVGSERRRIIVRDRQALAKHVCECYNVIRTTTHRELERIARLTRG